MLDVLQAAMYRCFFGRIAHKIALASGVTALAIMAVLFLVHARLHMRHIEDRTLARIEGIARTLATQIDAADHQSLLKRYPHKGQITAANMPPDFGRMVEAIRMAAKEAGVNTTIYTLALNETKVQEIKDRPGQVHQDGTVFVLMSSDELFYRHTFDYTPAMRDAFFSGQVVLRRPYYSVNGHWISVYVPIRNRDGQVVSVLEVDERMEELFAQGRMELLQHFPFFVGLGLVSVLVLSLVAEQIAAPIRQLTRDAQRLVEGKLDEPIFVENHDEVGMLSRVLEQARKSRLRQGQLVAAKRAAEEASRAKSAFLANMSHELRTPLNAIIGYSEMLIDEAQDAGHERGVDDLRKVLQSSQHLRELIDDILDMSKIEAGRMELSVSPFDVVDVVGQVEETMVVTAENNGNVLTVDVAADVGAMTSDEAKVRQILLNLLSNACKFTENGRIELAVRRQPAPAGSHRADELVFSVKDTGIGISQEQLDRLFQEFTQADASTTRKYGGSGLGLTISQRFCQMMSGRIEVTSQLGQGSTFTVYLPAEVAARAATAAAGGERGTRDSVAGGEGAASRQEQQEVVGGRQWGAQGDSGHDVPLWEESWSDMDRAAIEPDSPRAGRGAGALGGGGVSGDAYLLDADAVGGRAGARGDASGGGLAGRADASGAKAGDGGGDRGGDGGAMRGAGQGAGGSGNASGDRAASGEAKREQSGEQAPAAGGLTGKRSAIRGASGIRGSSGARAASGIRGASGVVGATRGAVGGSGASGGTGGVGGDSGAGRENSEAVWVGRGARGAGDDVDRNDPATRPTALVVAGTNSARAGLVSLLENVGMVGIEADSEDVVLAVMEAEEPDGILLDVEALNVAFWRLLARLGEASGRPSVPIVAVWGDANAGAWSWLELAGSLTLPVDEETWSRQFGRLRPPGDEVRAMVLHDHDEARLAIRSAARREGWVCRSVGNCREADDLFRREKQDVVFVDVVTMGFEGLAWVWGLLHRDRLEGVSVVAVFPEDLDRAPLGELAHWAQGRPEQTGGSRAEASREAVARLAQRIRLANAAEYDI